MDFISTVLGLQLPTLKARDTLREEQCQTNFPWRATYASSSGSIKDTKVVEWGSDLETMWRLPEKAHCDDDETASTLSDCDDSFSSSSESLQASVTFAAPLVTEVYLRPCTPRNERHYLYYNETDFRRFRMEYRESLRRKRSTVTFSSCVVSHELPAVDNKEEVYYSSTELKQFLEDFILSLDDKHASS